MITFSDRLYLGPDFNEKKLNKAKRNIRQGRGRFDGYVISLSNNQYDQLDIFHNAMLKQKLYHKLDLKVVGISKGYDEAVIIIQRILEDTIADTGNTDMKAYLLQDFRG